MGRESMTSFVSFVAYAVLYVGLYFLFRNISGEFTPLVCLFGAIPAFLITAYLMIEFYE